MNINEISNNLLSVFSQYMDDYTIKEFFTDDGLTAQGKKLLKEIKHELKKEDKKI